MLLLFGNTLGQALHLVVQALNVGANRVQKPLLVTVLFFYDALLETTLLLKDLLDLVLLADEQFLNVSFVIYLSETRRVRLERL